MDNKHGNNNLEFGFHDGSKQVAEPGEASELKKPRNTPYSKFNSGSRPYPAYRKTQSERKLRSVARREKKGAKREKGQ